MMPPNPTASMTEPAMPAGAPTGAPPMEAAGPPMVSGVAVTLTFLPDGRVRVDEPTPTEIPDEGEKAIDDDPEGLDAGEDDMTAPEGGGMTFPSLDKAVRFLVQVVSPQSGGDAEDDAMMDGFGAKPSKPEGASHERTSY